MRNKNFNKTQIRRAATMPKLNSENAGNMKEIQDFNNRQLYKKGFNFNTQAGQTNEFPIVLGGKCRKMFGIAIYVELAFVNDEDLISLSVNEEKILDNVIWWDLNPQGFVGNIMKQYQYFELPRPLSGSDSVQLQWQSANAHKIHVVFSLADKI